MTLRVMHCPQHMLTAVEHNAHSVNAIKPDTVGFTELDAGPSSGITTLRRVLSGYRVCTSPPGAGHSQEIPIALRNGSILGLVLNRYSSTEVHKISPDVPGPGTGNDRYVTIVRFSRPFYRAAHVATHTNAAIQNRNTGALLNSERTRVTAKAMSLIEEQVHKLINEKRQVVITGDFNYRTHTTPGFTLWEHSPQLTFRRLNMHFHEEGLDYVAWTPGLRLRRPVRVIPASTLINASDHPWLVAELTRLPRSPRSLRSLRKAAK